MKPISEMTVEEKNMEVTGRLNLDTYWIWEFHIDQGKVQLLREMMKREDWQLFRYDVLLRDDRTLAEYLTDDTGKLLDAVLEWKRRN